MQTQIRLENINKSYGKHKILENLNISIFPEDFITIIGASGSGKSTFLNILGTLEDYDSGEVESFGYKDPIKDYKNSMILRREKIAYLFQNFALIENMTVKENLDIALKYSKYKNDKEKIRQILDMLGVVDKIDNKIYELSGGQQQRVAMARVLLKPYQILLADEPTGSLDKSNKDILIKILIEENKKGKTIVLVSHDMDFIKISKRAYKIIDKRLELIK